MSNITFQEINGNAIYRNNQVLFSLLHPSRGRPQMAENAVIEWKNKFSGLNQYEYILSIDSNDELVVEYKKLADNQNIRIIINNNRSVVDAVNNAAKLSRGDVLIVVSDDFSCPDRWDDELVKVIGCNFDSGILVDDGVDARIMTLPIVGRIMYQRLEYIYWHEYISMFCDDDLTESIRNLDKLIDARHLKFQHHHWSRGTRQFDATDASESCLMAWYSGKRILEKRRRSGFGRRPRTLISSLFELFIDVRYLLQIVRYRSSCLIEKYL